MYNPSQPISTTQTTQAPLAQKPKRNLNLKPLFIFLTTTALYVVSIFVTTFLSVFSENIDQLSLTTSFNPLITIAYILVFYSVSFYYSLTKKQAYNYLLLALFLSYTITFVEGSMILVFLAPLLRKLKLIDTPTVDK